jgi:hypothetical protein
VADQGELLDDTPGPVRKRILIDVVRATPPEIAACTADECRRRIEWVTTVKHGRRMPIDHPLLIERVHERLDGSLVTVIDAARSHWASCVASEKFRRQAQDRAASRDRQSRHHRSKP